MRETEIDCSEFIKPHRRHQQTSEKNSVVYCLLTGFCKEASAAVSQINTFFMVLTSANISEVYYIATLSSGNNFFFLNKNYYYYNYYIITVIIIPLMFLSL